MSGADAIPAATVVLLRDGPDGLETLMLRRNSELAFGGAWVFPGGRVDSGDRGDDDLARARSAAVRETMEETSLVVSGESMEVWSFWEPPPLEQMVTQGKRRRFSTWFFVGPAAETDVAVDDGEITAHRWLRPETALDLQRTGEIEIVPPTWVTLHQLSALADVESVMEAARSRPDPPRFVTFPIPGRPMVLTWEGDVAYERADHIDTDGPRNRLTLDPVAWRYELRD